MIKKEHILELANQHLKGSGIFVTGIKIGSDNHINVFIDGDEGVTIKDCVALSRAIEGNLDRDREDYALDVSSHGATTPLIFPRQYTKHVAQGRNFEVHLTDGTKLEGELVEANDKEIKLQYTVRENKPIGKGKINVTKYHIIPHITIKESKIKLKY